MRNKKGQSILEYVLVLTIIIVAIGLVVNGTFKAAVKETVTSTSTVVNNAVDKLAPGVN